jgi:hypothetical protein
MTIEQIKAHLDDVFARIKTELFDHHSLHSAFFAGGVFASLAHDEEVTDYDLWFKTQDAADAIQQPPTRGLVERKSRFSTTLKLTTGEVIQLVRTRCGEPEACVASFDFRHCQNYYDPVTGVIRVDLDFLKSKKVEYNKASLVQHPVNTIERLLKFARRGYFVDQETVIALMLEIQHIDPVHIVRSKAGSR